MAGMKLHFSIGRGATSIALFRYHAVARFAIAVIAFIIGSLHATAQTTINFDDSPAPDAFSRASPMRNQLFSLGVTWGGAGAVVKGASWAATGYSSPNVLAYRWFSQFSDFTFGGASDTMTFSNPQNYVSFLAAGANGDFAPGGLTVQAYDTDDTLVTELLLPLTTSAERIEIYGDDIARVSYAAFNPRGGFVIDDIIMVPEPTAWSLLGLAFSAVLLPRLTLHFMRKTSAR